MPTAVQSPLQVSLSKDTSDVLINHVAETGEPSLEAVSQFVDEAVSRALLSLRLKEIRSRFSDMTADEIEQLVAEAVAWARSPEGRACE